METRFRTGRTASQINLEAATLIGGNSGVGVTLPFTDNFNDGDANGWSVFDEAGNPSNWNVNNSQYQQPNLVRLGRVTFDESYHLGSFSSLDNGFGLRNYRVSADIFPRGNLGDDSGIMFRYQDPNNYYRLSFDSRFGYTRLEKRVNGQFTALANNSIGYRFGELLDVAITVVDSTILVDVNNDPLFAVQDNSISQGTIALYSAAEVRFDNGTDRSYQYSTYSTFQPNRTQR